MTGSKIVADRGSVAIAGNNNGQLINVNAGIGSTVNVNVAAQVAPKLPSCLGAIIAVFARQGLSSYADGTQRQMPPKVEDKLHFNHIRLDDRLVRDYGRHCYMMEKAYEGVEQQNNDARYLVRRKAGIVYEDELTQACVAAEIPEDKYCDYSRDNAKPLIKAVIKKLVEDYSATLVDQLIEIELVDLAVTIIVVDAVAECEVLEKPPNVIAS